MDAGDTHLHMWGVHKHTHTHTESIEGVPQEWSNGVSPARQARKQGLAVHINTQSQYHMHDQTHNSVVAASLEVDVREKEMVSVNCSCDECFVCSLLEGGC